MKIMEQYSIIDILSGVISMNVYNSDKLGKRGICNCPFCHDSIKTFIVSEKQNKYRCLSCGDSGTAEEFLEKAKGMSEAEICDYINGIFGNPSNFTAKTDSINFKICEANQIAANYYHSCLMNNQEAYNYLKERGITDETIKKFNLGFSPYGVGDILKKSGIDDNVLKKSGLIKIKDGKCKDTIFGRIMFPIMVDGGNKTNTVGFGGRLMTYPDPNYPKAPKYLNTADSSAFKKKKTLFGFNFAKKSKRTGIILCEGYMDAIALHQAGYDNAVAALGTAFTRYHALLLKEVTDVVYLCFDSDAAGTIAKKKAIPILAGIGLKVKVLNCSPHKDPDEFIKNEGNVAFQDVIDNAQDGYEFMINQLKTESDDFEKTFSNYILRLPEKEYRNYLDSYEKLFGDKKMESNSGTVTEVVVDYNEMENDLYQDVVNEFDIEFN